MTIDRMTFEEPLHSLGERLPLTSFALMQALAWQLGSELVRRHPGVVRLNQEFPHHYGRALGVFEDRPGSIRPCTCSRWPRAAT